MNDLFSSKEKIEANLAILKMGVKTPFWKLLSDVLRANIELLTDRILNGREKETKGDIDRARDELTAYKNLLNTPEDLIHKYEGGVESAVELDPYPKVKKKEKDKA